MVVQENNNKIYYESEDAGMGRNEFLSMPVFFMQYFNEMLFCNTSCCRIYLG
ncbi:hypothetical protein NDGK_00553 [Clostridiales bacterium CHKCI001]|nr:hypothetical protein NDGK_00553 [Clostridiales bacterium CHKCI001]